MKSIKINTVIVFLFLFSGISYSQIDNIGQECGLDSENAGTLQNIPVKTPGSTDYVRALVIYVSFKNDVTTSYDYTVWDSPPLGVVATKPINPYSGTNGRLIDSLVGNSGTYFMDRYSQYTMSDYFCEMSMGAYDVIGDEYYFVTPQNEGYYDSLGLNRATMNQYVLNYLDGTQTIDWSRYDNWEFTGGNWVFDPGNGDGTAEMVIICYRNLPNNYNTSSIHHEWFWDDSYGGEASLYGQFNATVLTFDGIDVGTHNGVTAINFRHNTTHSELIMIHEYSHKIFGTQMPANVPNDNAHISHGMMTPGHDASTYSMSPIERSASVVQYITPTVVSPLSGDQTFTLQDFVEYGDVLKIPIAGTSDFLWVSNHQKNSIYDGVLRGGKNCYSTNFSEQDPYCSEGTGIIIERQGSGCSNMNQPYDLVSAEGKFDWAVDRTVFVPAQNYHHALGFDEDDPAVTIALLQNDHGEIDVKVYFDDGEALSDLPPSKPKNLKIARQYFGSKAYYPKITWDANIEPDFIEGGVYKILKGVSTNCESEPSYNLWQVVNNDVTEIVDEGAELYDDSAGSGMCAFDYITYH